MPRRIRLRIWTLATLVPVICIEARAQSLSPTSSRGTTTFEQVGAIDRFGRILEELERSIAPELLGRDRWQELLRKHRSAIEAARSHREFTHLLSTFLDEASMSHLNYFPNYDWRFWLFRGSLGFNESADHIEHVGILPQEIDGVWFVKRSKRIRCCRRRTKIVIGHQRIECLLEIQVVVVRVGDWIEN